MSKEIKGWFKHYAGDDKTGDLYVRQDGGQKTVCLVFGGRESDAVADVIAAAPDLLAACREAHYALVEQQDNGMHFESEIELLEAAINKAEGK